MTARHAAPRRRRTARHATKVGGHPFARAIALTLVGVLSFAGAGVATAYARITGNVDTVAVAGLIGAEEDRPQAPAGPPDPDDPNQGSPVNILVMGSDGREGSEAIAADDTDGERSDTTIVVHISADRQRVELVSIPRDSVVDVPECYRADGSSVPPRSDALFNSAFALARENGQTGDAAACTWRTVEANAGIRIDHFVVVNMSGFAQMVDALGGVEVCIPELVYAPKANYLRLEPGLQRLDGATATQYARARTGEGLGNGSDLNRINRQQEMLASMARDVLTRNILTDVPELIRFLDAVTRSLTISDTFGSTRDMAGLAYSLRQVPSGNISLMTVPIATAANPNHVVWTDEADALWAAIAADQPIVAPSVPTPTETAAPTTPGATTEPTDPTAPADPAVPAPETVAPALPEVEALTPDDLSPTCG